MNNFQTQQKRTYADSSVIAQAGPSSSVAAAAGGTSPTIEQPASSSTAAASSSSSPPPRSAIGILVAVAVVVAIGVGAVMVLQRRNGGTISASTRSTLDTILQGSSTTDDDYAADRNSPHARARQWILREDVWLANVVETTTSSSDTDSSLSQRVLQRFAVVVLAFATQVSSSSWINPETSECTWDGVTCGTSARLRRHRRRTQQKTTNSTAAVVHRIALNATHVVSSTGGGTIPPELRFLSSLRELSLTDMGLVGTIPSALFSASNGLFDSLYWFEVSRNRLTGSIPSALWTLPQLRFLYVDQNRLSGSLVRGGRSTTTTVSQLRQVRMFQNQLTGPMPITAWWTDLFDLEHWIAYENRFTGTLPTAQPSKLTYYDVSSNQLRGTIPSSLLSSSTLQTLYLEHNEFTGSLPDTSAATSSSSSASDTAVVALTAVYLHNNSLTGSIPNNFLSRATASLTELRLGENTLQGTIPARLWSSFPNLQRLDLGDNQLQGTLPTTTSATDSFTHVGLHNNRLSGPVPSQFGYAWKNLQSLRLEGNALTGTVGPDDDTACTTVWPLYEYTQTILSADCRSLLVTDQPDIVCGCCTFCA